VSWRTTNHTALTVTARTALTPTDTWGSEPVRSTSSASPATVSLARSVMPSPTSRTSLASQDPSGSAATAARTRRSL